MPLPIPQLDDRSFDELVAEVKARIPVHTPEWNNFNDSDPGITLVQLFAFMTENLLYRSNRIPEANRLKFLNLLGVGLMPAKPGRGLVTISNERGPVRAFTLDEGTEMLAGNVPFRTRSAINILPVTTALYYKKPKNDLDEATAQQYRELYETFLEEPTDALVFYETQPLEPPEIGKPLPELDLSDAVNGTVDRSLWVALLARTGGPAAQAVNLARQALSEQTLILGIYPSTRSNGKVLPPESVEAQPVDDLRLVFEIAAPDPDDPSPLPPPRYTRLTVEYAENVLETPGIVQVTLPKSEVMTLWEFDPTEEGTSDYPPRLEDRDMAERVVTWLRIRLPESQTDSGNMQQSVRLSWVGINAARVIQMIPMTNERLGVATGAPEQAFKVTNTPIILTEVDDPDDTFVLEVQNSSGEWIAWTRTDDLYAAGPDDAVYTVDPESGMVHFGSGLRGKRPPLGSAIRASYEYGGGPEGAVNIDAINKSPSVPGGFKVRNPVPTWGASRGETTAEGENSISSYLRHRDRLVTAQDFKTITERTPGVAIGRVEVLPLFNPDKFSTATPTQAWPGAITVMVVPDHNIDQPAPPVPDRLFLDAVCEWLDPRRLVTTEIFVRGPEYVPVWVSVGLVTMAGQVRAIVHREVQAAIREYLSPLLGGPGENSSGWPLGMEVRRQDLEAVAVRVGGVRYVNDIRLAVNSGGTLKTVEFQRMAGIQMPWLAGISVREGTAEDPAAMLGQGPDAPSGNRVHVPVVPQKC